MVSVGAKKGDRGTEHKKRRLAHRPVFSSDAGRGRGSDDLDQPRLCRASAHTYQLKAGKLRTQLPIRSPTWSSMPHAKEGIFGHRSAKDSDGGRYRQGRRPTPNRSDANLKLSRTGQKDAVLGYPCENWKVVRADKKTVVCAAKGLVWYAGPGHFAGLTFLDQGTETYFPLRTIERDTLGAETMRLEATKIESKRQNDALFTVPADYQVLDMSHRLPAKGGPDAGAADPFPPKNALKLPATAPAQ